MTESEADAFARAQITDWNSLASTFGDVDSSYIRSPLERWSERLDDRARPKKSVSAVDLLADVRYALCLLRKTPVFALAAIGTLALGIGANTTIFSLVHTILLQPLPYQDPEQVVMVWEDASVAGFPRNTPAPANYRDWRAMNQSFTDMAATLVLLVAAGLMLRTLANLNGVERGFDANNLLTMQVPSMPKYADPIDRPPFYERIIAGVRALPGVRGVAFGSMLPFQSSGNTRVFSVEGRQLLPEDVPDACRDVLERGYERDPKPGVYVSQPQGPRFLSTTNLIVRVDGGSVQLCGRRPRIVREVDPEQPIRQVRTMTDVIGLTVGDRRQQTTLLVVFGALALLIASLGLYGLLAQTVSARGREIGIRIALGATWRTVVQMVMSRGVALTGAGIGIGVVWRGRSRAPWARFSMVWARPIR